jgi:MFS family permease
VPLPRTFRALAHRDFRLFWCGQLVSLIGTWMQSVGQSWLVLELTNSAFLLGMLGTLQFSPVLLLSFVGGAISDRIPKRRLLMATQTALMLQAFALSALAWSGHVRYWHVAALASLYGLANSLDMPARQSFVADLVPREDLLNAVALNSAVFNGARVVGPAVAGLLVARFGSALAFAVNGLSFVAVIIALWMVRAEGRSRPRPSAGLASDLLEAVRYATGTPRIVLVLGLLLTVSLFVMNYNVLVPLLARDVLGEGAHGFGLMMAALGVGALAGALVLASLGFSRPPLTMMFVPALVASAGTLGMGLVHRFAVAIAMLVVIGFCQILFMTSCNTTLQVMSPDALRGRVMGLYAFVFVGATPFGSFLIGSLAGTFGVRAACIAGGTAGLAGVLAFAAAWRRRRDTRPA